MKRVRSAADLPATTCVASPTAAAACYCPGLIHPSLKLHATAPILLDGRHRTLTKIKMLVEQFSLERAADGYHLLRDGKIEGRAVITPDM